MADTGDLAITVSHDGDDTVVALAGQLDLQTTAQLRACLRDVICHRVRLVIDLSRLSFVDSTGLATLVSALKRVRNEQGEMVLRAPSESTRRKIEIAGLSRVLPFVDGGGQVSSSQEYQALTCLHCGALIPLRRITVTDGRRTVVCPGCNKTNSLDSSQPGV